MACARSLRLTLVLSILLARASTQPAGTPTSASNSASPTTSIPAGFTTAVIPIYLYDVAESLYSEYFPSATPANIGAILWPTQIVIGTATYGLHQDTPTGSQKGASPSNTAQSDSSTNIHQSNQGSDKKIAIIIGVVIGAVAIIVMAVLFFCLRRRRKDTGSFFMRRSTPSMSSMASRRAVPFGTQSYMTESPSNLLRDSDTPRTASNELVPDIIYHQSSRSTLDDNNYYTPAERPTSKFDQHEPSGWQVTEPTKHKSSGSVRGPAPPFSPIAMQQMPDSSQRPAHNPNPFASPEDREADDVVSPILLSRSFERKGSPIVHSMVHFPSMSEVSEFDFADDGGRQAGARNPGAWHPSREKLDGRHELA